MTEFIKRVRAGDSTAHRAWTFFLRNFEGIVQILVPGLDAPFPIIVNMRREN